MPRPLLWACLLVAPLALGAFAPTAHAQFQMPRLPHVSMPHPGASAPPLSWEYLERRNPWPKHDRIPPQPHSAPLPWHGYYTAPGVPGYGYVSPTGYPAYYNPPGTNPPGVGRMTPYNWGGFASPVLSFPIPPQIPDRDPSQLSMPRRFPNRW